MIKKTALMCSLVVIVTLFFSIITVRCQTILFPSRLHLGEKNTLLLVSDTSDANATLKFFNKGYSNLLHTKDVQFTKGQMTEVPLHLPSQQSFNEQVTVEVTFSNGAKSIEDVEVSTGNGFIFLQTDKPIYRVSETVRFRVLRLDRTLSPINETVVLKIFNHQKIKVEEVVLMTSPPLHIAQHSFNFPLIAKPGTWLADVYYGPKHKLVASTSFDVTEYELPAFKIDFTLPPYILSTNSTLDIKMNVSYTYGKPVQGTVYYRYGIMEAVAFDAEGIAKAQSATIKYIASSNTYCFKDGVMNHRADVSFIKKNQHYRPPLRFVVEAVVRECATNVLDRSHDSSVAIVERPYTIELRKTVRRYKPFVFNFFTFEILDPHGQPTANVPFSIEIKSTDKINPEILLPHITTSTYIKDNNGNFKEYPKTDDKGQVIFNIKTSLSTSSFEVKLATKNANLSDHQQSYSSFIIEPFSQEEKATIWITGKHELTFNVGDRFKSSIELSNNLKKENIYLMVMSKGIVIYREKILFNLIDFQISNQMVPSVRLLVLAYSDDGELVADSLRLTINLSPSCGLDISMVGAGSKSKSKKVLPGGNVTFSIKGSEKGDVIGFHAVDEAVYVLRKSAKNGARLTYTRSLERSDSGCGPGSAANSLEVIRTVGFKALSPHSIKRFDDDVCQKVARRKKRESALGIYNETFKQWCCWLGKQKTEPEKTCTTKYKILKNNTSEACADEYFLCCVRESKPGFQASLKSTSADKNTNTNEEVNMYKASDEEDYIDFGGVNTDLQRSDFRDTWLFDLALLDGKSVHNFTFSTPHSITSWAISTLSITAKEGFCVNSMQNSAVTTYKPFFIKISLPHTIIEYEQTEVVVTVFNYQASSQLTVQIIFHKVKGICSDWLGTTRATRKIMVNGSSTGRATFAIVPIFTGTHTIHIEAISGSTRDTVKQNLTVLAQGIEQEQQLTFDLDPQNRAKRETRILDELYVDETSNNSQRTKVKLRPNGAKNGDWITTKANVVPKTLRYIVTAVGERFNPQLNSIEELNELIRKPKGCGEQNMYYMAFNLYSLLYLEQIGRSESGTRKRGMAYLQRALKQQLEFRKPDGSYSAFKGRPASIWLTGFVAKIVCLAEPYLESQLDEQIVHSALTWLQSKQKPNGAFYEEHPLLHQKAMGGVDGAVPLTAYLLIVFHQCRPYLHRFDTLDSHIKRTIRQGEEFVISNYTETSSEKQQSSEPYRQALVAYALSFSDKPLAAKLKRSLTERLATSSTLNRKLNQQYWKGVDWPIETAAYALLAFITLGKREAAPVDLLSYISIANWLNNQQKRGTFDNTQDTIVALDALSKFYALYQRRMDGGEGEKNNRKRSILQTDVHFDDQLKTSIHFNKTNIDLLQTFAVDNQTQEIDFRTTGNGLGKVNLLIIYNEFAPNGTLCRFDIEVDVYEYKEIGVINENEFDENYFDDTYEKRQKLFKKLGVSKKIIEQNNIQSHRFLNSSSENSFNNSFACCEKIKLPTKRSLEETMKQQKRKRQGHTFDPLPKLNTVIIRPIVIVLSICVKHSFGEYESDMAVLEVSILSGYRPIVADLEKYREKPMAYIVYHDISPSKIIIYFRTVPSGFSFCFQFRLYQEFKVEKMQSALIRMYNYYEQEWTCSRFYSSIREANYIGFKCEDSLTKDEEAKTCKCVTNERCPSSAVVDNILKSINNTNHNQKQDEMEYHFCQYTHIIIGTIELIGNATGNEMPVMDIKVDEERDKDEGTAKIICGDIKPAVGQVFICKNGVNNATVRLEFNTECAYNQQLFGLGQRVVVMHNPGRDNRWLVNGNSVLKLLKKDDYEKMKFFVLMAQDRDTLTNCSSFQS